MGTTRDDIRAKNGVSLGYVLCIEGYPYLISDRRTPTATNIGWAATDWSLALPGLEVTGSMSQKLEPWGNELEVPQFTFKVLPEITDQFAIDMFKDKPAVRSELTTAFDSDAAASAPYDIKVKDASIFAAGQTVYIGTEAFGVTGTPAGTSIPVPTGNTGWQSPHSGIGTNRSPGPHAIAGGTVVGAYESQSPVYVSDSPPTWRGKKVGLWVHRIQDGTWDTKAEAELLFAGTIDEISESGLHTIVSCEGVQKALLEATLMKDQWTGKIKEGYEFVDGDFFYVFATGSSTFVKIVSGTDFTSGRYTATEVGVLIADYCDGDGNFGVGGADLDLRWSGGVTNDTGPRFTLSAQHVPGTDLAAQIWLGASSVPIMRFMGFMGPYAKTSSAFVVGSPESIASTLSIVSDDAPGLIDVASSFSDMAMTITLESTDGTFVDHTSLLPPDAQGAVAGAEVWSFYSLDGALFFGRRDDDTTISAINVTPGICDVVNNKLLQALRKGGTGIIKQVYFAADTFTNTMARLFASTDGKGQNSASYDTLPWGAGIPWSLLGDGFTDSLEAVEQASVEDSIALLIEKPTRLWDVVKSDFALRMAMPIWKDGGIVIAQFTTPNATTAEHTLTEANKSDEKRTTTGYSSAYMAHTLKIKHSRNPMTDKFTDEFVTRNSTAYQSAGQSGVTKTIKARNSYASVVATGASVEALADMISSRFLPVLSKPVKIFTRSIAHTHYHMAPGDTVNFSDNFIRDPATGIRGVSNRAGVLVGVRWSMGISSGGQGYFGECDILYSEEDRQFPIAPSMQSSNAYTGGTYTSGWDSGGNKLLVLKDEFSGTATNDSDDFASSDEVRVTEMDPADPASAATFLDTLVSIGELAADSTYDEIELLAGFGSGGNPAYDATKIYLINNAEYGTVLTSQKLVSYQADDVDGRIVDAADPNQYADAPVLGAAAADLTELPSRHAAEQYGDGVPLSASFIRDQVRMANNLANYKTAPAAPQHLPTDDLVSATPGLYLHLRTFPFLVGDDSWSGGRKRQINCAPKWHMASGSGNLRITSSQNPPKGDTYTSTKFYGAKQQVTFSTSSGTSIIDTVQQLNVVKAKDLPGITWITIEATTGVWYSGLGEFWLGPIQ